MRSVLKVLVLSLSVLNLAHAAIYNTYTNNTGTYKTVIPDNIDQGTVSIISGSPANNQVWVNGIKAPDSSDPTSLTTLSNGTNVVDVPTYINANNVNHHTRSGTHGVVQNSCTKCVADECVTNSCTDEAGTEVTTDAEADEVCCYVSGPRKCDGKTKDVSCKIKIEHVCGKRCTDPKENEEVYFDEDLEVVRRRRPPHRPSINVRPRHPYERLPINYGRYPGNTYTIGQQTHPQMRSQAYRASPDNFYPRYRNVPTYQHRRPAGYRLARPSTRFGYRRRRPAHRAVDRRNQYY